jgi:fibronectin type 3 domain-containing protein
MPRSSHTPETDRSIRFLPIARSIEHLFTQTGENRTLSLGRTKQGVHKEFVMKSCYAWMLAATLGLAQPADSAPYPFADDFEQSPGLWLTNGTWGCTAASARSPSFSMTDSPGAFYTNRTDAALAMASGMDLSAAARPTLLFYTRHAMESGYDVLTVESSTDGGSHWTTIPEGTRTGIRPDWYPVQCPLDSLAGLPDVTLRFRMITDDSVVQDGIYLDDIVVGERPLPVTAQADSDTPTSITLAWSVAGEPEFAAYLIVRGLQSNLDIHAAAPLAVITDRSATNWLDRAVSPKTRYYYRIVTTLSNGLSAASAEISTLTLDGMEAPFQDNGEGGPSTWIADSPWALAAEAAASGLLGWSDSPDTNYGDHVNAALTLVAPVNITGWSRPTLMFHQQHHFLAGDFGYVEVSTNAGSSWSTLAAFTASSSTWSRSQYDLSAYAGGPSLLLRFRVTSDASGRAGGWKLDDISLSDAPAMVPAPDVTAIQPTAISLTWPASDHPAFSHYVVIRSLSNNPTINTPLTFNTDTNAFTDTGLMVDSNYHYRVFAVDAWGGYSPASPTATTARTIIPVPPVSEDFESGAPRWLLSPGWTISTGAAFNGSAYLENGSIAYSNNLNSTASLRVNLTGLVRPVLRFYDQHRLAVNDYGYVEISSPGRSTFRMYGIFGSRTNWQEQVIDLSYYKEYANVQITFRLITDANGTDEGWKIDDLRVSDEGSPLLPLPLVDDFNDMSRWVETSRWAAVSGNAEDTLALITPDTFSLLNLNGDLDLTSLNNPHLSTWIKGHLGAYSRVGLHVSINGGGNWSEVWARSTDSGNFSNEWQRIQIPLLPYKASQFRVRWELRSYNGYLADPNVFIDKLTIAEAPPAVGVLPPEPALKSVQLSWTPSALGDAFQAYRIWRSPDTNPNNGNDAVVGVVSNEATLSFVDTGLSIGATYYYWVYACDTNDIWSLSTNYVAVTTVPVVLPFEDTFDDLSQWDVTGSWGIDTNELSLSSSPVGDYGNSQNITAHTAVNLSGTVRPVLRFRDVHRLAVNDYGYVEISAPGRNTYRMYGVYGSRTNEQDQVIDLSYYKDYANVRITFRLNTDGNGTDAGWKIDNLQVTDEGSTLLPLPLVDDFNDMSRWVETSRWAAVSGNAEDTLALITPDTFSLLNLNGDLDLTSLNNPQLSTWIKGHLGAYSRIGLHVSINGGGNWSEVWARSTDSGNFSNEWQRIQVSLLPYKASQFRVRWELRSYNGYLADPNVFIDKLTIAEAPPGLGVLPPVPALKSAQINWTPSTLGDAFQAYRIWRSPDANPNNGNDAVVGEVSNEAITSFVDTGLSIGATYYYWVYACDTNDLWTLSTNYVAVTTVPVVLPFTDTFDDLSQWDVTGSWGIDTNDQSLSSSPVGGYGNSLNMTAHSAVNLSGTVRPVLRFRDVHRLAVNDYGFVEISAPGRNTYRMYGVYGSRTNEQAQVIDLSYYKDYANVRITFRLTTDGNGTDEGWKIDDLQVTDEGSPALDLPFVEGFADMSRWVETSRWAAVSGSAEDTLALITPDTYSLLNLNGDLDLTSLNNPQLSTWIKGHLGAYSRIGLHVSINGGGNWSEVWARSTESGNFSNEWQRIQISLLPYKASQFRVRWELRSYNSYLSDPNVFIDKLTIAEAPPGLGVLPPEPALKSAQITWTPSALGDAFQAYRIWRSPDANPNNGNDSVIGIVTNEATTSFVDTGLPIGATYYYWVYLCDTNDIWTLSTNYVATTTVPVVLPFADAFEDMSQWDVTGSWGIDTNEGALTDSPVGNYSNLEDSYAQTAVNLTGTIWPTLRFRDFYRIAAGDYGFVEVSANGSSYTRVYGITGAQTNGVNKEIDLSQWKDQPNLRIRFHLITDGSGTDDGWYIDEVTVVDRGVQMLPVPFYDGFENGLTNWLESVWVTSTNTPFAGSNLVVFAPTHMRPEVQSRLPLAGAMDLSLSTNPLVTFRVRGVLGPYAALKFQVSSSGGLSWSDLWVVSYDSGWNTNQWQSHVYSLVNHRTADVRFRFLVYSYHYSHAPISLAIDHFSVGETTPGAPSLFSPANYANTPSIRPTLIVNNAFDPDFDPLTYRFEVYGDEGLSNLLAQVPAVASGIDRSTWQVDVNLANSQQYWWRCRASDASNTGPWMATATFFINETNSPPGTVLIAGPPKGATLRTAQGTLSWYPTTDPDAGDDIRSYHIQIDPDPAFPAPLVDDANLLVGTAPSGSYWTVSRSLSEMQGWEQLTMISNYYWRIRAQDTRFKWSDWSAPGQWFIYGVPAPDPYRMEMSANGSLTFYWDVGTENFYVWHSPSLVSQNWNVIAGPLDQNQITLGPPTGTTEGYYRVTGE